MISTTMKQYQYVKLGQVNEYGEKVPSAETKTVTMSINLLNKQLTNNVLYEGATYVGLTKGEVDDKCVIETPMGKLKVLYVNPLNRFKEVFMAKV